MIPMAMDTLRKMVMALASSSLWRRESQLIARLTPTTTSMAVNCIFQPARIASAMPAKAMWESASPM